MTRSERKATMTKILCATRGGEASRRTQERAIALARQHNAELIFLYVFDLDFLEQVQAATIPTVAKDMQRMGGFFLTMAQEQACAQGVEARTICRQGKTKAEIKAVTAEENIDVVILGQPSGTPEQNFFAAEALKNFAAEIEAETEAQVVLV